MYWISSIVKYTASIKHHDQLSPTFQSNSISSRVIIQQTLDFHYSIAHSFVNLETKFHTDDIIIALVTCKKACACD